MPGEDIADALDFTATIPPNGYVWWYLDALSDDGDHGLTIIAFIGSVFSPYYAFARRRGVADPENHVALNVALYGKGGKRWSMTERGRGALARTCLSWKVGPSQMSVDDGSLHFEIEEWTVPLPSRLSGRVRVTPVVRTNTTFALDDAGRHHWCPIAPRCRVEVVMEKPARRWSGEGYLDCNRGECPLENDFAYWDWSRASVGDKTAILYDVVRRDGTEKTLALCVNPAGHVTEFAPPSRRQLPANSWRVGRRTQSEGEASVIETLEDTPFYSRSLVRSQLLGAHVTAMHESLSLDRFRRSWVQMLMPFRMPRRG
ncbi:MAG: carotenoid 1,2-hydratase [Pseudomonadota bacterium]